MKQRHDTIRRGDDVNGGSILAIAAILIVVVTLLSKWSGGDDK